MVYIIYVLCNKSLKDQQIPRAFCYR